MCHIGRSHSSLLIRIVIGHPIHIRIINLNLICRYCSHILKTILILLTTNIHNNNNNNNTNNINNININNNNNLFLETLL